MHVLVTGAAGHLGTRVVQRLRGGGHDVTALDVLHPTAHRDREMPDGVLFGDVRNPAVVATALRGVDAVVHLAAVTPAGLDGLPETVSCNEVGTAVLLAAMARAKVRNLVLSSSVAVYGDGGYRCDRHGVIRSVVRRPADLAHRRFDPTCERCGRPLSGVPVNEDAPLEPRTGYATTRVTQEHLAATWARHSGGACTVLRYSTVYGLSTSAHTADPGVVGTFQRTLERGDAPLVFEDGRQLRDLVHVADAARATVRAVDALTNGARAPASQRSINVASGDPHTVGDLAHALAGAVRGRAPVITGDFRAADIRHLTVATGRAKNELEFAAAVAFGDGVRELANHYQRT